MTTFEPCESRMDPSPVKLTRDPHRRDRIMGEAEKLTVIWRSLGPEGRRMVNEHVGHDLYRALHALAIEVEERTPLPEVEPDEVNMAPGGTGFFVPPVEADYSAIEVREGYPAEQRVADLEKMLNVRHDRREALHHARKAWGGTMSEDADRHADNIVRIAQAFEKYLTDGTVPPAAEGREPLETAAPASMPEVTYKAARAEVVKAAIAWAEHSHFANLGGPENWRNWSDTHDQNLINAVAVLTGRPEINNKEKP